MISVRNLCQKCDWYILLDNDKRIKSDCLTRCRWRMNEMYFYRPQRSWGKVIFSQVSVILLIGGVSAPGGPAPGVCACSGGGGACSWGVSAPGGCLLLRGRWMVETPRDGHCCGRYAFYWNTFLFKIKKVKVLDTLRYSAPREAIVNMKHKQIGN